MVEGNAVEVWFVVIEGNAVDVAGAWVFAEHPSRRLKKGIEDYDD